MCIASIIKNLSYLHDMEKLNLPKTLLRDIFWQSKTHFHLPEFDGIRRTADERMFHFFIQQDTIFHKKFIIWFQTKESIFNRLACELSHFYVVYYYFTTVEQYNVRMCLKCMKFQYEKGYYERKYWLLSRYLIPDFIMHPSNWCHACQQVPLFQVLTYNQFDYLYAYDIYENDWYNRSVLEIIDPLIKTDYFEKGFKVKSQYVLSKKSFGGNSHPYIN